MDATVHFDLCFIHLDDRRHFLLRVFGIFWWLALMLVELDKMKPDSRIINFYLVANRSVSSARLIAFKRTA